MGPFQHFLPAARNTAVIILATVLTTCGGSESPTTEPPPATQPPATTPPATQPPLPRLGSLSCDRIGEARDVGARCAREVPTFLADVERAIDEVVRDQPGIFNLDEQIGAGGFRVRSSGQFLVAMIDKMDKKNLCAHFDGEELQVKDSNAFNDQYHLITSAGHLRRGDSSYRATCYPATFPEARPLPGLVPGCSLPPSREITCGREDGAFLAAVDAAVEKVGREHPEVFDKNRVQPGSANWWKILDVDRFVVHMVDALRAAGFCAHFDGEEIQVKNQNKSSEHFDVETSAGFVRRGEGSYRSTCYPAAF